MKTSELIIKLRDEFRLSQEQLAAKILMTVDDIVNYETGIREPNYPTMMSIMRACGKQKLVY